RPAQALWRAESGPGTPADFSGSVGSPEDPRKKFRYGGSAAVAETPRTALSRAGAGLRAVLASSPWPVAVGDSAWSMVERPSSVIDAVLGCGSTCVCARARVRRAVASIG